MLWLRTPPIEAGPRYDSALCARVLGLNPDDMLSDVAPQRLNAGNPTLLVAVRDKAAVDRSWLDLAGSRQLRGTDSEPMCIFVFTPTADGAYSRMFAPEYGVPEDPASGSSTGPLAAFMMRYRLVSTASGARFVSEQGTKMGRRSFLHVHIGGENGASGIEIGGDVAPVAAGSMRLPFG